MFPALAPVTRTLILVNVLVFGLELISLQARGILLAYFALWPWDSVASQTSAPFGVWQLLTYGFLHDPWQYTHIIFNMFALFMFGSDIERSMGTRKYLAYYFVCILGGGLVQLTVMAVGLSPNGLVYGASAAVFGILLAYAIAFPYRKLIVIPIPIPLPAWLLVTFYAAFELWSGIYNRHQGVAHFAHLGGAAAGYLLILYWRHGRR